MIAVGIMENPILYNDIEDSKLEYPISYSDVENGISHIVYSYRSWNIRYRIPF